MNHKNFILNKLLILIFLITLGMFSTANAQVTALSLLVNKDGALPFDADDTAGNDSSISNAIVRANDQIEYLVSYNAPAATPIQIILTLPSQSAWDVSATASNICNGTGGGVISADKTTLTCNRIPAGGIELFFVKAWVGSLANGSSFTTTLKIGASQVSSPSLTVSAFPKNEIQTLMQGEGGGNFSRTTVSGQLGVKFQWVIAVGSSGATAKGVKGVETITNPVTYTIKVAPGTVVMACQAFSGGGTRNCSQASPGADVLVTVNSANLNYLNASAAGYLPSGFKALSQTSIILFTPFGTNFPVGASTPMSMQIKDFDPNSVSGVSNFGSSYATDYDPSKVCPTSGAATAPGNARACLLFYVDRTVLFNLATSPPGVFDGLSANNIYGDNDQLTNSSGAAAESVLIGQKFRAMSGVYNPNTSEQAINNVTSCFIWNPELMELDGIPILKYRPDPGTQNETFTTSAQLSFPNATSSQYILEYSSQVFTSDAQRRAAKCGVAGNGDAGWTTTPSSVSGGASAVSSIRYKFIPPLNPQDLLGLIVPLIRSSSASSQALANGAAMPWFVNISSTETGDRQSTYTGANGVSNLGGGRVNSIRALVRHNATVSSNLVAPGSSLTLTLSPVVIGNVGDNLNTVATNTKITVTMPNSCVSPILSSLPAGAVFTPANLGADGLACTADDGTPASVVLNLGDIIVPSGSLSASPYQAHVTSLPSISFSVIVAPSASLQTIIVKSVISSNSDLSPSGTELTPTAPIPNGRTRFTSFAINGVSAFRVIKTASGLTDGKVGPNEVFTYTINFSNGGSSATGKGRFVDIIPFDGDRNNTSGLGVGKIVVTAIAAAMDNASMGTVSIETSTDPSLSVQTAITTLGNEDGLSGVNWTPWVTGNPIPSNLTAIRFTTSTLLNPSFRGFGVIAAKAPTISQTTSIKNTVNGRTEPINNLPTTAKVIQDSSLVTIAGLDGATLRGSVFYDLNANAIKDVLESGVSGSKIVITCTAGACLTGPQGTVFSVLTDANGAYSFSANLLNKIFDNNTASGTPLASFQGILAGTWSITETPPTNALHVYVSTFGGTINSIPSGTVAGRTISGVAMIGNGVGENYNFGERLDHGKITVTKALALPSNVTGAFNFVFTATCDKPVAGTIYTATLLNYPTNNKVDIVNIPVGSTCVVSETLPTAPNSYEWATPNFSALTPSGVMVVSGVQTTTATNALIQGVSVVKSIVGVPTVVAGNPTQFDVKYKIEVINKVNQSINYNLSDAFGFDPDVTVVGAPTIVASANVTSAINALFTGSGSNKNIISNEAIAAGSTTTPSSETFEVTVRVNLNSFATNNNTCNTSTGAGLGLFNKATLTVNGLDSEAVACTNTPTAANGKITVNKILTMPTDVTSNFNFDFKATCDMPSAGAEFTATLTGFPGTSVVDIVNIPAGASCTVSETLPVAPTAYTWRSPVVASITPNGVMAAAGTQTVAVTNELVNGLTLTKSVDAPVVVPGQPDHFDIVYHVAVSNATATSLTYDLTDTFGFDPDLQVVGLPVITKSENVSGIINSGFNGSSSLAIISSESIDAASGSPLVPVVESYTVKVRVKLAGFDITNNVCNSTGTGMFNTATIKVGSITRVSTACTNTPQAQDGKIVVTKNLTIPVGVSTPINLSFKATCDKPTANTEYSVNLAYDNSNKVVEIPSIPPGATCVLTETLPTPPTGFKWKTPLMSSFSPAGTMPIGGTQTVTVDNELEQGVTILKTVVGAVEAVSGETSQFDLTYQILVSNTTESPVTYSLKDTFGFDSDISVIGMPVVTKSPNVTQNLISGFIGSGTHTDIVSGETIGAAVGGIATIETYTVKVRIKINGFNSANNICNGVFGNGLFNNASLTFGSATRQSDACINTPGVVPIFLKLRMKWVGGVANTTVSIPSTIGFTSANTTAFQSVNLGNNNYTDSDLITLTPTESGALPVPVFSGADSQNYSVGQYNCNDGSVSFASLVAGTTFMASVASAGKTVTCTITATFVSLTTTKSSVPASGSSVQVGDEITYTLKTTVAGDASISELVLTDVLDAGLTITLKPSNCVLNSQTMICTFAAGLSVGDHFIVYKAEVNSNVRASQTASVKNKVTASSGSCTDCETSHTMWSVDTSKTSDAAGKKGVSVGDTIEFTLKIKVTGGASTQDVTLIDKRSVGLAVGNMPNGCSNKNLTITCILPSGSPIGEYKFIYRAVVTDEAGDFVSNVVEANKGTCLTSCKTVTKVIRDVMLRITKSTLNKIAKIADFVRYEVVVENLTGPSARRFFIVDQAAPGLSYVEGSLKIIGDKQWNLKSKYPLVIEDLDLAKDEKLVISYLMRVNAGASRGVLKNTAWADDIRKYVTSNKATATVSRGIDPDFETTRIFGKVFEDLNADGIQNQGEQGIPGVRLITTTGLIVETDSFGRYHIEGIDPGLYARGSNYIVKLDTNSLAKTSVLTTENPIVKRITPALPVSFNFGIKLNLSK
jgi:fimbrial isopeptide formation D2 family protein